MGTDFTDLIAALGDLWAAVELQLRNLMLPSRLNQIAILGVCLAVAWAGGRTLAGVLRSRVRATEGLSPWQLRTFLILEKRLVLASFVVLSWSATLIVRSTTTFPSRSYLLALVATVATAWLIVSLVTRLVRNRTLRRIVSWGLWIFVTLYYLGLVDPVATFLDGLAIELGGFRLSVLAVLKALVVTGVLFTAARLISQTAARQIRENEDISPSMQVLAVKALQVTLFGAAVFIGLKAVGFDLTGLAVLSGAIGVGLGFGLQKVVSNLVSGVIILLDKSIKPGDVISLGETFGWINALGARYVSITTRDGREYLIPNEDLITGQVVNWSHSNDFVRLDIHFGTSYADDPHLVRRIAVEAAKTVPRVLNDRAPVCHITGFGDSSIDYILRFWIRDPTQGLTNIRGNVFLALWDAFRENGISIPFPQREVRLLEPQKGSHVATD
jgi:small-conductance mechanosensitive channel